MTTVESTVTDGQSGTLPSSGVGVPVDGIEDYYPVVVAVADLLVGGLLFAQFTSALGLAVAAIGVVVLCSLAWQFMAGRVPVPDPLRTRFPARDS